MTSLKCVLRRGVYAVSAIDLCSRTLGDAHLLAVSQHLESNAGRLAVLGVGERNARQMDRRFLGNDATFLVRGLLLVTLHHVHATHQREVFLRTHFDNFTAAALVATAEHDDLVAFPDLGSHYSTSG